MTKPAPPSSSPPQARLSGASSDADVAIASQGDIVDAVYEVALDPNRYDELVSQWHQELRQQLANRATQTDTLADHFDRASVILERVHQDDWQPDATAPSEMPELLLSHDGRVLSANSGAAALLSARAYQHLNDLDLTAEAREALLDVVSQIADRRPNRSDSPIAEAPFSDAPISDAPFSDAKNSDAKILRINRAGDNRPLVVLLAPSQHTSGPAVTLRCAEIIWPESLGPLLATAFHLTTAECEIVQSLVAGYNATGIAEQRGTSRETVRTQIRELLAKTGTHSQLELIRMIIGFSMMAQQAEAKASDDFAAATSDHTEPSGKVRNTLITLSTNHHLDVYQYGDISKPPVLVFHDEVVGDAFVRPLLREQPDLHFVVVARPGYGRSSLLPNDTVDARSEQTIIDIATGLERLFETGKNRTYRLERESNQGSIPKPMPLLAHGNGLYFACRFAARFPERCVSITAIAPSLPHPPTESFNTTRYAAFISGMARLAPAMLRFAVQAGFAMYARSGPQRFLKRVYGDLPVDMAVIDNQQHLLDLQNGGRLTLAQGYRGFLHDEEAIASDWTSLLTTLSAPIYLLLGDAEAGERGDRALYLQQQSKLLNPPNGTIHLTQVPHAGFFLAFSAAPAALKALQSATQS